MTNKEMVIDILMDYGCQTSRSISCCINRKFNVVVSPAKIAGILRPLVARGYAATDRQNNATYYWLNDCYKEMVNNTELGRI